MSGNSNAEAQIRFKDKVKSFFRHCRSFTRSKPLVASLIIGAAFGIASPSCNSSAEKNKSSGSAEVIRAEALKGITSQLRNVHHGIKKDGKYYVDTEVVVSNNGPKPIQLKEPWLYSVCFDPPGQCLIGLGGSGGSLDGLKKGEERVKRIRNKNNVGADPEFCNETMGGQKKCTSFRQYEPAVSVTVNNMDDLEKPLYENKINLGRVGDYK